MSYECLQNKANLGSQQHFVGPRLFITDVSKRYLNGPNLVNIIGRCGAVDGQAHMYGQWPTMCPKSGSTTAVTKTPEAKPVFKQQDIVNTCISD